MGISWRNGARPKENSPTSGLFCFLVARGGIDQDRRCLILLLLKRMKPDGIAFSITNDGNKTILSCAPFGPINLPAIFLGKL